MQTNYTFAQLESRDMPLWQEDFPVRVYNWTELTSQIAAPIWYYCATSSYVGGDMFYVKQLQWQNINDWALSFLQNFLSKAFSIGMYYDRWLEAWAMNDVLVTTFYTGKLFYLYWDFDMIVYIELEEPSTNLYRYYPYVPPNLRDRQYYIDRGLPIPSSLSISVNADVKNLEIPKESKPKPYSPGMNLSWAIKDLENGNYT